MELSEKQNLKEGLFKIVIYSVVALFLFFINYYFDFNVFSQKTDVLEEDFLTIDYADDLVLPIN
jgi:hypothetical protein